MYIIPEMITVKQLRQAHHVAVFVGQHAGDPRHTGPKVRGDNRFDAGLGDPEFICCEAQLATSQVTRFLPDFYLDIDSTMERKTAAMAKLAAQPSLVDQYTKLARYRGLEAQIVAGMMECTCAEGFVRIGKEGM